MILLITQAEQSKMIVVRNDNVHACDVDYTLLFPAANVKDPTKYKTVTIDGVEFVINMHIVYELRVAKARGQRVKLWSQGGYEWAEKVARALNLENVVDEVECKPKWYWDDKDANAFMDRCYRDLDGNGQ